MQNFETLIGQALAEGKSVDSIAKQVTEAFNTVLKQKQEAEAKAKAVSARTKLIDGVEKSFWTHVKEEKFSGTDAAALAWLVIVNDSEYGKSIEDPETLKDLFNHIINLLEHAEDSFRVTKGMKDAFGDIAEIFDLGQVFKVNKPKEPVNKSNEKCSCGLDRKCQPTRSDKDVIESFLRGLH